MVTKMPTGASNSDTIESSPKSNWHGFEGSELDQMLQDDLSAGISVSLLLTAIVLGGLLIGFVGVMLSLRF